MRCLSVAVLGVAIISLIPPVPVRAQAPAQFYKGRTVEIVIGYSVGGGYDQFARMIARHIGKHIPGNPTVVPRNMEGAGGMRLANWLNGAAPRDGTTIGAVSRSMAFEPLLGNQTAQYDGRRVTFIGSANDEVSVCLAWHSSGVGSWPDMMTKELVVGSSSGLGDDTYQFPALLNAMFGAHFKIIGGYPGGNEINLAMERGEVQGRCGMPWSTVRATRQVWIDEKKVNVLMQFSLTKHAELPEVPLVMDLARNDEERRILKLVFGRQVMGRPYVAPPDLPKDRTETLRAAFMATMRDAAFVMEVEKAKFEVTPVSGQAIEDLVLEIYRSTPLELAQKAAAMMK